MPFWKSLVPAVALSVLAACHPGGRGARGPLSERSDVLVVVGTGEAFGRPDVARLTLGVEAQNENPQMAVEAVNAKMHAVIGALKQQGVAEKDIQTNQLSIQLEQPPPQPYPEPQPLPAQPGARTTPAPAAPIPPRPTFRVTNTVLIAIRNLDRVGAVVGAALGAGANQAWGLQFDVEDPKPLRDQARARAMEDAAHRARELARLGGLPLGRVLNLREGDMGPAVPQERYAFSKMAAQDAGGGAVPVEGGQVRLTHDVRVVYQLGEE